VMILAPIVRGRKGEFKKEIEKLQKSGFTRARIDGELRSLDEEIALDKRRNHTIEVVVDRLLIKAGIAQRLEESVRAATKLTEGVVIVSIVDGEERLYSERMACVDCGVSIPQLEPRSFSFNSAYGACKECHGLGTKNEVDPSKIVIDDSIPIGEMRFVGDADKATDAYLREALLAVARHFGAGAEMTFAQLPKKARDAFFFGLKEKVEFRYGEYIYKAEWKGATTFLLDTMNRREPEEESSGLESLISPITCRACNGARLQPESLAVKINGRSIADYAAISIVEALGAFAEVKLTPREEIIAGRILKEVRNRLSFLQSVGLGYLALDRPAASLSGGEGQRIRLATQIGSQLRGVLYVLDEPSIGLHPRDNERLLNTLAQLRDLGNTVLVVEHDEETIRRADYVVDLG
ncbi:MAG: excinuclease ABC subunit UvrA, partial [Blastocatellia bacterium]